MTDERDGGSRMRVASDDEGAVEVLLELGADPGVTASTRAFFDAPIDPVNPAHIAIVEREIAEGNASYKLIAALFKGENLAPQHLSNSGARIAAAP